MSIQDTLLDRFRAVVDAEIAAAGGKPADGYRAVAEKTRLGYDYIYQIYKGKPAHKPKRPSLEAMDAINRAYGVPGSDLPDAPQPPSKITPKEALAVLQAELEQKAQPTSIHHIDHAWPFQSITREEWSTLADDQKMALEAVARTMLTAHHASGGGGQHDKRAAA